MFRDSLVAKIVIIVFPMVEDDCICWSRTEESLDSVKVSVFNISVFSYKIFPRLAVFRGTTHIYSSGISNTSDFSLKILLMNSV